MRAAVWLALLLALPAHAADGRSAVRLLFSEDMHCSAVVIGARHALTAAHCLHAGMRLDGKSVGGRQIGPDLALLDGTFAPPYAPLARLAYPARVLLEGYGCDPVQSWLFVRQRREIRGGLLLAVTKREGLEVAIAGRACAGDSGGAVYSDGGGLVAIITARASDPELSDRLAFATPIP